MEVLNVAACPNEKPAVGGNTMSSHHVNGHKVARLQKIQGCSPIVLNNWLCSRTTCTCKISSRTAKLAANMQLQTQQLQVVL